MKHRVLVTLLFAAGAVYGADREFDHVVQAIENHYGVKRTQIPFMGVANLVLKFTHPAGTSGFKVAIFEDMPSSAAGRDSIELDRFMDEICRQRLHALVVTHSRRDGESTYILAGEIGRTTKVLVTTFDRHDATVVEVTADFEALLRMIESPDEARKLGRTDGVGRTERPDW